MPDIWTLEQDVLMWAWTYLQNLATMVFIVEAVMQMYHMHQDILGASIDENLPCQRESGNFHDSFSLDE